jgi:Ca-activated chloride channel family protein
VLLTDGENERGRSLADFRHYFAALPSTLKGVPVFPILFGDARLADMSQVAEITGGGTFDARAESLTIAFRRIRGNQ